MRAVPGNPRPSSCDLRQTVAPSFATMPESLIGRTVSHYRILEQLGEGGMGVVYLAEDILLGRRVAIKTLHSRTGHDSQFRARFLREARAVSTLSHPHIATIYD